MRFGLFYEHQIPRPWDAISEERTLVNALEQIELADKLGIDYVWEVEHHFLEEYSHSSAPEVFLAAASQRTSNIRLGHGIVQLPPAFNHPARVAERIATLDLVSGGRVDFGTGEASSQMELGGFGIDREAKREQWEEALDAITRMFVEEPFAGYDGKYISMPQRNVIPKPKQKPHPPLWVACSRRETILLAAKKGLGALSFSFVEPEDAKEWVDAYYSLLTSDECVPGGFEVNPNLAVVLPMMCHQDEATAIERGIDGGHFFGYSLAHFYVFGKHKPGSTNVWEEFNRHRSEYGFAREIVNAEGGPLGMKLLEQGLGSMRGAIGTPDQIAELIERYERAGVDQVIFVSQSGGNQHEHVCESLELFAREVLPRFKEKAEDHEAKKRDRLAGAIEKALARREPARSPVDGYAVTPEGEPSPARRVAFEDASGPTADEPEFASIVRGMSDDQLLSQLGNDDGLRLIFGEMERHFEPEKRRGWAGDVQYDLEVEGGRHKWVVHIDEEGARVAPGESPAPAVTFVAALPDFLRIAAGQVNAVKAMMEGRLRIEGNLEFAAALREMFGGPSGY